MMEAAYFLVQQQINQLPVDPFALAKKAKIPVLTYGKFATVVDCSPASILERYGPDGFTQRIEGQYVIWYNNCNPTARVRWTIMHELGHIFLGHMEEGNDVAFNGAADRETDAWAAAVLCPLPVVHLCDVASPQELARLTGLSTQAARYNYEKLQQLRSRGELFKNEAEQALACHFLAFISAYISKKRTGVGGLDLWRYD